MYSLFPIGLLDLLKPSCRLNCASICLQQPGKTSPEASFLLPTTYKGELHDGLITRLPGTSFSQNPPRVASSRLTSLRFLFLSLFFSLWCFFSSIPHLHQRSLSALHRPASDSATSLTCSSLWFPFIMDVSGIVRRGVDAYVYVNQRGNDNDKPGVPAIPTWVNVMVSTTIFGFFFVMFMVSVVVSVSLSVLPSLTLLD